MCPSKRQAYWGHGFCNTLKHVVIPASIEEFASYDEAFILCTKLQTVTNLATTPQNSAGIFNDNIHWAYEHTPCVLQVPQGSKAAYESQWPWSEFKKIVEINPANFNPEGGANDDPDPDDTSDGTYTSLIILFKDHRIPNLFSQCRRRDQGPDQHQTQEKTYKA